MDKEQFRMILKGLTTLHDDNLELRKYIEQRDKKLDALIEEDSRIMRKYLEEGDAHFESIISPINT